MLAPLGLPFDVTAQEALGASLIQAETVSR